MPVKTGKPGTKYIRFTVDAWYQEDDGQIHLTSQDHPSFHTTFSANPSSRRHHEKMYALLERMLKEADRWPES